MAIAYVLICLAVVIYNYKAIPNAIVGIIQSAFGIKAAAGGALGTMLIAMQKGVNEEYKGMGTTIEVLAFVDNAVIFAHVGDSRIALIRNGEYKQLTNDHSLVNALIKAGQLTEEEAAVHPQRNIITQSIGQAAPIEADLGVQQLEPGDYILANSDGLTNMISVEQIVHIVNSPGFVEEKTSRLVAAANEAGGHDNITVALIKIESEEG